MEEENIHDPHRSKIDPDDPRLKLPRPKGRLLKKGPVIGVSIAIIGIVFLAVAIALIAPSKKAATEEEEDMDPKAMQANMQLPNVIRNAPDNDDPVPVVHAAVPESYPALGGPLPGEIGAAMVDPPERPAPANKTKKTKLPNNKQQYSNYPGNLKSGPSAEALAYKKALTAPLFFSGGSDESTQSPGGQNIANNAEHQMNKVLDAFKSQMAGLQAGGPPGLNPASLLGSSGGPDQNMQRRKNDFLGSDRSDENYVKGGMDYPKSPYEIKATTIIPVALVTGINTDLPGEVIARVRENVYDTVTGNHLLIPQGATLKADYDSMVAYGQERILLAWSRLIRPDGSSIDLESMPGMDMAGYAGVKDKVDNHWMRIVGGVLISSFLSATVTKSQGNSIGQNDLTFDQVFASNAGQQINDVGQRITDKNINIQPTLTVPPGYTCNVLVNKDMILPPYK